MRGWWRILIASMCLSSSLPTAASGDPDDEMRELLQTGSVMERGVAMYAISAVGPAAIGYLEALKAQLGHDDEGVRANALEAIAALGEAAGEAEDQVADLLVRAGPDHLRGSACRTLGLISARTARSKALLRRTMAVETDWVSTTAAAALLRTGEERDEPLKALRNALTSEDWQVRRAAALEVSELAKCSHEALPLVLLGCASADNDVRVICSWALSQCPVVDDRVRSLAGGLLSDGRGPVRAAAIAALARCTGEYEVAALRLKEEWRRCLGMDQFDVIRALGLLVGRSPTAVEVLEGLLEKEGPSIQESAAKTLLEAGHVGWRAVNFYRGRLHHSDWCRRFHAVRLLLRAPIDPELRGAIIATAGGDEHFAVRWLARALQRPGTRR